MKNTFLKYLVLCIAYFAITELTKSILNFDKLLYNSLAENLTSTQINNYLDLQNQWKWVTYIFIPVYISIKILLISSIIYSAVYFFSNDKISFKNIWNIILKVEFIFLLVPVLKIIWFVCFQTNYTLTDFQNFFPLSALNIVGHKGLEPWLVYPLQTLNLFELAYMFVLAYYIGKLTKTNLDKGLNLVFSSYLPALVLWVCLVMFLTLNLS